MAIGYIPKKTATGALRTQTEIPAGRLNLGGVIPALGTLSSEIIIDNGAKWQGKLFILNCLSDQAKATIFWDYGDQNIILFHSDMPFSFYDDFEMFGNGIKKLRMEITNMSVSLAIKASLTLKYEIIT